MGECLTCNRSLRFIKFKCADGYVCKHCYEKVSLNFTQTIKTKTRAELYGLLKNFDKKQQAESFEISRRINQLVLFDDQQKQLCLPHHKKYTKEALKPEIYSFSAIKECQLVEDKIEKIVKKKQQTLGCIKVAITFIEGNEVTRDIWLIPNYISRSSMPYKTMKSLAQNIVTEINRSKEMVLYTK